LLSSLVDRRRTGPLEPFEKRALSGFIVAATIQALLGVYRATLDGDPIVGALAASVSILVFGALWLLRVRQAPGHVVVMPIGLLIATAGFYSAYSAMNAPFVGVLSRFSIPAALFLAGAVLLFAEQDWQFQRATFALAAIAFLVAQVVLTIEARNAGAPIRTASDTRSGILGELQMVRVAREHVDTINARDPNARIVVTQWIVDEDVVAGFGTMRSKPAAFRAQIRGGRVAQWQVYGGER
jgi:hypothetical protein